MVVAFDPAQTRPLAPFTCCLLFPQMIVFFDPAQTRPLTRIRATNRGKIAVNATHFFLKIVETPKTLFIFKQR